MFVANAEFPDNSAETTGFGSDVQVSLSLQGEYSLSELKTKGKSWMNCIKCFKIEPSALGVHVNNKLLSHSLGSQVLRKTKS